MFGGLFDNLFKSGVWDTNLLFSNAAYWTLNSTRPNFGQLPNEINYSTAFLKMVKDAQWAMNKDGSSHGHVLYACGPDYFFSPSLSGQRSAIMGVYQPHIDIGSEADPYNWQNFIRTVRIDGAEVYRKSVLRSEFETYKWVRAVARFVASPPNVDPVTKQATNRFFTVGEIKGNCYQTNRFINILLTSELYMIVATQQTILNEEILTDQNTPLLKRLNALNMVVYRGTLESGQLTRWTI